MSWKIKVLSVDIENVYLEVKSNTINICTKYLLKDVITKATIENDFRKSRVKIWKDFFEKYFENLLTPTPEELTLVDIEFGGGSADAYLQLLEETKKILD